ncbi:hypothetical protein SHKM778_23710 [Streptomyces sp. KM77-8]|uniref:Uncharacterized protein n=1 Tax=Streptomyces haneummycinicus TaxID=3074435 RepID=A0AAT9HFB1_9ACTN
MSTGERPPRFPLLPPEEAASWRRIRRYAVPRTMIGSATARRTAGDWRGACAAAGVDIDIDLPEVVEHCGDDVADALEEDLRHLVPDLVRWHLPRILGGRTTLDTGRTVVLARYRPVREGEGPGPRPICTWSRPHGGGPAADHPALQHRRGRGDRGCLRQRNRGLAVRPAPVGRAPHRRTARARRQHRPASFFHADGRPRRTDELPTADPGPGDAAARAEWTTLLHRKGETVAAFAAAGIELDLTPRPAPAGTGAIRRSSSADSPSTTPAWSGRSAG